MKPKYQYLQSYLDNFWQYEDNGKVIAIPNSYTIGYSDQIFKEIIPHLAKQNLPRFGSMVLVLAATNSQGINCIENISQIINNTSKEDEYISKGISFLKILSTLPNQYKKKYNRINLLRAIFQNSHNSLNLKASLKISKDVSEVSYIENNTEILIKKSLPSFHFTMDFKVLSLIGEQLDSLEAILVRLVNIPKIESEIEFEEVDSKEKKESENLIEQLSNDHKTYHIGTLVSQIMGGLNIPFHSSLPSEQPLGGVADLTNKGSFEKLLISEFAFDDNILMSRLANNESLYHHREVPPADNDYEKIILIDVSLKNWGTIRSISFAVMLAIVNHPKNLDLCRVFLVGNSYLEIEVKTINDIINALYHLDYKLNPGLGLMELFTSENIKTSEIFFIATNEILDSEEMILFNNEFGKRIDHWIHPDQYGNINVYKNPKRGKRFIQELKLPLDKLWVKPKRKVEKIEYTSHSEFPILFPISKSKARWDGKFYSYIVTKDRALLRNYDLLGDNISGWEMITNDFAPSDNLRAVITETEISVLVSTHNHVFSIIKFPSRVRIPINDSRQLQKINSIKVKNGNFILYSYKNTITITKDGKIKEEDPIFNIKTNKNIISYGKQVLRNIKSISITMNHKLKIGKQNLFYNSYGYSLQHTQSLAGDNIFANNIRNGIFRFNDGSIIEHDKNGMLTLISSNKEIPEIFIPLVINGPIGICTKDIFCGFNYYKKELMVDIILEDINQRELNIIQLIKISFSSYIGLKAAKAMIDIGIISLIKESKVDDFLSELDRLNVAYNLRERGIHQEYISATEFQEQYIDKFISQIILYAT